MIDVKQLAEALYNQKVEEGWENVSMETQLKRAVEYFRVKEFIEQSSLFAVVQAKPEVCDEDGMTEEEVQTWKDWYEMYSPKHK